MPTDPRAFDARIPARLSRRAARVAMVLLCLAPAPRAFAQTAPVPDHASGTSAASGAAGLLARTALSVGIGGMPTEDPRFSFAERAVADLDLFAYRRGRINLFIATELVMGSERRAFDLNQANVIFESSASYGVRATEVAVVLHHVSRHVVDREFDRVPAWHTVGARVLRAFSIPQGRIDLAGEYGRVVQHTFVDYTWTSQATVRIDRQLAPRMRLFAEGRGGVVGVDRALVGRRRQAGGRAEGGLRLLGGGGVFDLFAALERRVDGHPASRDPSSWVELGFRFSSR
jgi:hypothetical protein